MVERFNYDGPHKSERGKILNQLPSYKEMIDKIRSLPLDKEQRALLSMMLLTGGRVSEIITLKWSDITIKQKHGYRANLLNDMECTHALCDHVEYPSIEIIMKNLKAHKKKGAPNKQDYKTVPIIYADMFIDPFTWICQYLLTLKPYDPEKRIFNFTRGQVWWLIKKHFGPDFFPHLFRHISATNDLRLGIKIDSLRKKLGHRTASMYLFYSHLNTEDLKKDLQSIYGEDLSKISKDDKPLTPAQVVGAFAAAHEVRETGNTVNIKKESIIMDPFQNKLKKAYITDQGRKMRDIIRDRAGNEALRPKIVKKEVKVEYNDILQVV
jgi:integrase